MMERDGGSLRSNVVHDDGDAKTMFTAEDVLEESRLSRALEYSQRRTNNRRTRREAYQETGEKCHRQSLGGDARLLCALALGALLDAILGHFDEMLCVCSGKDHNEIAVAGEKKGEEEKIELFAG